MKSIKLLHYKIDSYSFITDKDAGKSKHKKMLLILP